jgi:hypothetical protein
MDVKSLSPLYSLIKTISSYERLMLCLMERDTPVDMALLD